MAIHYFSKGEDEYRLDSCELHLGVSLSWDGCNKVKIDVKIGDQRAMLSTLLHTILNP